MNLLLTTVMSLFVLFPAISFGAPLTLIEVTKVRMVMTPVNVSAGIVIGGDLRLEKVYIELLNEKTNKTYKLPIKDLSVRRVGAVFQQVGTVNGISTFSNFNGKTIKELFGHYYGLNAGAAAFIGGSAFAAANASHVVLRDVSFSMLLGVNASVIQIKLNPEQINTVSEEISEDTVLLHVSK